MENKHYYKIDVAGRHGYSFMVFSTDELDECEVIDIALRNGLFEDDDDADYAIVDVLVSDFDFICFIYCGCFFDYALSIPETRLIKSS